MRSTPTNSRARRALTCPGWRTSDVADAARMDRDVPGWSIAICHSEAVVGGRRAGAPTVDRWGVLSRSFVSSVGARLIRLSILSQRQEWQ